MDVIGRLTKLSMYKEMFIDFHGIFSDSAAIIMVQSC